MHRLRQYRALLKLSSPFSKAKAVVDWVVQLNHELETGKYAFWLDLGTPRDIIEGFRREHALGARVIFESENPVQLAYRYQFERLFPFNFLEFSDCEWALLHSPIQLPLSDVGLVQVYLESEKANLYMLPISPTLLLEGWVFFDAARRGATDKNEVATMTLEQAEGRLINIGHSAMEELICSTIDSTLPDLLARTKRSGAVPNHFKSSVTKNGWDKSCEHKVQAEKRHFGRVS